MDTFDNFSFPFFFTGQKCHFTIPRPPDLLFNQKSDFNFKGMYLLISDMKICVPIISRDISVSNNNSKPPICARIGPQQLGDVLVFVFLFSMFRNKGQHVLPLFVCILLEFHLFM